MDYVRTMALNILGDVLTNQPMTGTLAGELSRELRRQSGLHHSPTRAVPPVTHPVSDAVAVVAAEILVQTGLSRSRDVCDAVIAEVDGWSLHSRSPSGARV